MKRIIAYTFIVMLVLVLTSPAWALTGYDFYSQIDITNTTGTDITGRFMYRVNADNLINNNFIYQADADDSALTYDGSATDATRGSLGTNECNWYTDITTVPANTTLQYELWTGNAAATLDQRWACNPDDETFAIDLLAGLMDTNNIFYVQADVELYSAPAVGETWTIISRAESYELYVDSTPEFRFRVYTGAAAYVNSRIDPDDYGFYTENSAVGATDNWDAVSDASDLTYITNTVTGTSKLDTYTWDQTGARQPGDDTTNVDVNFRVWTDVINQGFARGYIYDRSTNIVILLPERTINAAAAWLNFNNAIAYGGSTEYLEFGVILRNGTATETRCAEVYALIDGDSATGSATASYAATVGTEYQIVGVYNSFAAGSEVQITRTPGGTVNVAQAGATRDNDEPCKIGLLDGYIDDAMMVDTTAGTTAFDFDFEQEYVSWTDTGTADSGSTTTIVDAAHTEVGGLWNNWALEITSTTDGAAPLGEVTRITDWNQGINTYTFETLSAAVDTDDTYELRRWDYAKTADSGTVSTIVDAELTSAVTDYWGAWYCTIIETTDRAAPEGETRLVTKFDPAADRLHFEAENFTVAPAAGDIYKLWTADLTLSQAVTDYNNLFSLRVPNPPGIVATVGATLPAAPSEASVSGVLAPGVAGDLNPDPDFEGTEQGSQGSTADIPAAIMTPLEEISGVNVSWIWWFGYGLLCILILVAAMKKIGINLLVGWFIILVITGLFVTYGPIPWWFLFAHGIGGIGIASFERMGSA